MCQFYSTLIITIDACWSFLLLFNIFKNSPQPNYFIGCTRQGFVFNFCWWQRDSWLFLATPWQDPRSYIECVASGRPFVTRISSPIWIIKTYNSTSYSLVYIIPKLIAPFKFWRTFFATFKWLSQGLAMNWLRTLTEYAMLGLLMVR